MGRIAENILTCEKIGSDCIAISKEDDNKYCVCWKDEEIHVIKKEWYFDHPSAEAVSFYWYNQIRNIVKYMKDNPDKPWPYIIESHQSDKIIHMCREATSGCLS